jgi:hypothetical protein
MVNIINPSDFTINNINAIDVVQIRNENSQITHVNIQTAYDTILNNPNIQKLSFNRNPDNVRIQLIPDVGNELEYYTKFGLDLTNYNILPDNYYIVELNITEYPPQFTTLYHFKPI